MALFYALAPLLLQNSFDEEWKQDYKGEWTLKQINDIGKILLILFVTILAFLTIEIIMWIQNNSPPAKQALNYLRYEYDGVMGPSEWKHMFRDANGSNQSPININLREITTVVNILPLCWYNYGVTPDNMVLSNTGHTVLLTGQWSNSCKPILTCGVLGHNQFVFKCILFRWGVNSNSGSEHTLNCQSYALELQMQLVNKCNDDDIVCVSYFYKESKKSNPVLEPILKKILEIQAPGTSEWLCPFPLQRIVFPFCHNYYSYHGSLTYPPCTEKVLWLIYPKAYKVSYEQLGKFRSLCGWNERLILKNCRPPQEVNNRQINLYTELCDSSDKENCNCDSNLSSESDDSE